MNTSMEDPSANSSRRIGFYPCCCDDIEEPRRILAPFVDEILFCDLKRRTVWKQVREEPGLPTAIFVQGDVRDLIPNLPPLTVLFYRNDSSGEGGSRLHIVGKDLLPLILRRFDPAGGWIFSDGSNSGRSFQNLLSPAWHAKPSYGFKLRRVEKLSVKNHHGGSLHAIEVKPLEPGSNPP